jgi:4-amino-4-deoxy-L-arabinose transferase-like glycosyltransferase
MVSKKSINKFLDKIHLPLWLTILLALVLLFRIPNFIEPYSYGDEMIYLSLGEAVRQGIPLYGGIHDNKPPLLYITAAIAGNLFWFKVILAAWSLITVVLFWKLSKVLFPKSIKFQKVSTIIFAILTTIPLLEGHIANAENFMIGPIIAAFLILLSKKLNFKNLFTAGVLFSIATLFKVPAAFDIPAIIFLWIVMADLKTKKLKVVAKNTLYLSIGFIVPIAATFVWYFARGAFSEYLIAAFLQNFGYLSSWRPDDIVEPFLTRNGPLLIRAGVVAVGLAILYWKRKKLSKQFIFVTAWLLLNLFAASLSERPYPHYLLQAVPAVSLLLGILFTQKTMGQSLSIIPLTIVLLVPVYLNYWHYSTTAYYVRFAKFATNNMTKEEYLDSFGGHIIRNYEISTFLVQSTTRSDKVFVWGGDSSMVYALSRRLPPIRYVASYHVKDFSSPEETIVALKKSPPKQIVVLPDASPFPELIMFLRENYILVSTIKGAEIWNQISPEIKASLPPSFF